MLIKPCIVIVIASYIHRSRALSWPRSGPVSDPFHSTQKHQLFPVDVQSSFTKTEFDQLFRNADILESHTHKPDCFRRTVGLLRAQCSELETNEHKRVHASISLTLCELATAKHFSPPLECAHFAPRLDSESSIIDLDSSRTLQASCVEALSRSAQFWSSYSGYLREIPQLCFAFRRWHDTDTAKDIYKNATLEKVALIRVLSRHNERHSTNLQIWDDRMIEMRDLLSTLRDSSINLDGLSREINVQINGVAQSTFELYRDAIAQVSNQTLVEHSASVQHIREALVQISTGHTDRLSALMLSFGSQLEDALAAVQGQSLLAIELTSKINRQWSTLDAGFSAMQDSLAELVEHSFLASHALQTQFDQAESLKRVQLEASQSASQLAEALALLTYTTRSELGRINETAVSLRDGMCASEAGSMWRHALGLIWQVDAVHFTHLSRLPFIRLAGLVAQIVGFMLQTTLSSFMSLFVFLLTCRKYLESPAAPLSAQPPTCSHSKLCDLCLAARHPSRLGADSSAESTTRKLGRFPDPVFYELDLRRAASLPPASTSVEALPPWRHRQVWP